MSRTRMDWDWVDNYPIYVMTNWLDHGKFKVTIVQGVEGDQSAINPVTTEPFMAYETDQFISKKGVVDNAFKRYREKKGE